MKYCIAVQHIFCDECTCAFCQAWKIFVFASDADVIIENGLQKNSDIFIMF